MLTPTERSIVADLIAASRPELEPDQILQAITDLEHALDAMAKIIAPVIEAIGFLLLGDPFRVSDRIYRKESTALLGLAASMCETCNLPELAADLRGREEAWAEGTADEFEAWADELADRAEMMRAMAELKNDDANSPVAAFALYWVASLARRTVADEKPSREAPEGAAEA